jgi:hypothetical protein
MSGSAKTLIEVSDIVAVEFECPRCRTILSRPLAATGIEPATGRLPVQCFGCGADWFAIDSTVHPNQPQVADKVREFLAQLKRLIVQHEVLANVRLEVNGVIPAPKQSEQIELTRETK